MSGYRNKFADKNLDELSKLMEDCEQGSSQGHAIQGEFLRRQTQAQIEAATAMKRTAISTALSALFVAVTAIASVAALWASVHKISN